MLAWLGKKLLAAPIIGAILGPVINGLLTAQKQKLDAAGSTEARKVEIAAKAIDLDKREAELNAQIIVAEQGNWLTRSIRPLLALPVVILLFKILVYDKALGQWTHGRTDPLDANLWGVVMAVVVAYMGGRTAEKVADKIAGVFKK